jgi:ribosome-associated protein
MIAVTSHISIDENDIEIRFVRSPGPGGQHVNKVATAVQLRFKVKDNPHLPKAVERRLTRLAGHRMTREGVLVISAHDHRSQARNRDAAMRRLLKLVRLAAAKPKRRIKTRPTAASRERRLRHKRARSETKTRRKPVSRID